MTKSQSRIEKMSALRFFRGQVPERENFGALLALGIANFGAGVGALAVTLGEVPSKYGYVWLLSGGVLTACALHIARQEDNDE